VVFLERTVRESKDNGKNTVEACAPTVFWVSPADSKAADSSSSICRHLIGEIHFKGNLQPSFSVLQFRIEVYLSICLWYDIFFISS
jgi:hypothetical protein